MSIELCAGNYGNGIFDTAKEKAFTYYVNQIHEMDNFLRELTAMLESRDEETVLVMYGDHLPGFIYGRSALKMATFIRHSTLSGAIFHCRPKKENLEVISWQRMYSRCLACRKVI